MKQDYVNPFQTLSRKFLKELHSNSFTYQADKFCSYNYNIVFKCSSNVLLTLRYMTPRVGIHVPRDRQGQIINMSILLDSDFTLKSNGRHGIYCFCSKQILQNFSGEWHSVLVQTQSKLSGSSSDSPTSQLCSFGQIIYPLKPQFS